MFRQIHIKNFRALREFGMTGLGRVNLLVGTNNCGKTSVLEAIHILSVPGSPRPLWNTLLRRGEDESSRPLRLALERGVLRPDEGCRLASEVYLLERGALGRHHAGWLPPELERGGELTVVQASPRELLVATTIPDVAIARQLRALHPERAIRWRAAPAGVTKAAA